MDLIYWPSAGVQKVYPFNPVHDLTGAEAELIESVGGPMWDTWDDFSRLFMKGNMRAQRAALWVMIRRTEQPRLAFDELDVRPGEVRVQFDDQEVAVLRAEVDMAADLDPEQKAFLLEQLGEDDAAPLARSEPAETPTAG